jgi:hypothetical protein
VAVTEPAPLTDPAPAAGLDVDSASSSWPAVVDLVRTENPMLARALEGCRPVAVEERELTLAFPSSASFLKRKAEQDDHRRVAIDAFKSVTGERLALRFELRELAADEAGPGTEVLSGDELVRRFMEEFDAEEILDDGSEHGDQNKREA